MLHSVRKDLEAIKFNYKGRGVGQLAHQTGISTCGRILELRWYIRFCFSRKEHNSRIPIFPVGGILLGVVEN
jgi:hypothetical protein